MNKSQLKTVIISGANGYFGKIAQKYFRNQGWDVIKACRDSDGDIQFDLDTPDIIAKTALEVPASLFIHAAAAHEVTCKQAPYQSIYQNVAGTRAALEFCLKNQIPKFVYISTFHVFGNPAGAIDEITPPVPANDYGLTNRLSEEYVELYNRQGKLKGMVIRPSNFFGTPAELDRCRRWTLTPLAFCRDAVEQKKIILRTPGYQQRNFVSILDLCRVIEAAVDRIDHFPLLHVAGPDTLSIRELAQCVQRMMKKHLHQDIELIIPAGNLLTHQFSYTSRYLADIYTPKDRIENSIAQLCIGLNKRRYQYAS
ncbi:NAD-dependent epimerase/dehydratase family protein [Halomicronema hongdechloris]|nr:NAD(P)-dependent oxidoreductase [Halomicronema hongdechloris]